MSTGIQWTGKRSPLAYLRALRYVGRWTFREGGKFRWWLWSLTCCFRRTCPANAQSLIVWGYLRDPRIDEVCARDCALNGGCYCNKLGGDGTIRGAA